MKKYFRTNIASSTKSNNFYRKVVDTTKEQQLVLMSIEPGDDIPKELHKGITQLIRVEAGRGVAIVGGERKILSDDTLIIIPSGVWHQIINTSKTEALKLYSVYSPPHHLPGTIHRTREEAL